MSGCSTDHSGQIWCSDFENFEFSRFYGPFYGPKKAIFEVFYA